LTEPGYVGQSIEGSSCLSPYAGLYTLVLACLFPILAALLNLYLGLVQAALFGQLYRESLGLTTPDTEIRL